MRECLLNSYIKVKTDRPSPMVTAAIQRQNLCRGGIDLFLGGKYQKEFDELSTKVKSESTTQPYFEVVAFKNGLIAPC